MTSVFALSTLVEDVRAQFTADELTANIAFGWREPAKAINQGVGGANRVLFVPGVDGKVGQYAPPRNPGRNPRPLRTLLEQATVLCWAVDTSAPNDELAQYEAARTLHDQVVRAIYLSPNVGHGSFDISDPQWVASSTEKRFGAEIKFTLTVQAAITDELLPVVDPPATAETDITTGFVAGDEADGTDTTTGGT